MEKNDKGVNGLIERLAFLSDEVGKVFPKGKSVVVYSLVDEDFNFVKTQVGNFDSTTKQFKIDISGIEFIFLKDELLSDVEDKS
jgi:hypothetical protein